MTAVGKNRVFERGSVVCVDTTRLGRRVSLKHAQARLDSLTHDPDVDYVARIKSISMLGTNRILIAPYAVYPTYLGRYLVGTPE